MPVHTQTPGFCHRAARCLALLLLSTVEVGLSYRSEPAIDKLNSTLSPAHQQEEAANKTGPDSAPTDRLGHGVETQAVVPYTASRAEEAHPRGRLVPASALVAIGRTSIFRSSVGKLISSLAQALRTAVDVGAATLGHASNQLSTASGIMLLAGTRVQSNLISFIGWGGVAAGGWNAVNAAEGIASQPGACKKVVQGAKLVVSLGATGLSIASLLCTTGVGVNIAGFAAAAIDNLWLVLEPALDEWCASGWQHDDVEVTFEAKHGLNSEGDVKRLMKEMLTVRDGDCSNRRDIYLTPEAADQRYRPTEYGFADRMQRDMDDMAHCTRDLFAHKIGAIASYMDWYCTSSWD
mmetsp:Transcript_49572/g.156032  ORF Transcript_49572/g.156032 Transcript_49572/m.156032 type:complete len:350 (+) Transcript_49572:63-1112(+)